MSAERPAPGRGQYGPVRRWHRHVHGECAPPDGTCTTEFLGATTGSRIPAGAAVVAGEYGGEPVEVGIWAWPRDPALPALPRASDPVLLAELFRGFGLSEAATLDIRPCGYLPSRHAVLEVRDGRFRWFVKVVRPSAVADLRHRHDIACRDVPVPPVLAATGDGVIVLPAAKGTPLQTLIIGGDAALPSPEALESVLNSLPAELMKLTPNHRICRWWITTRVRCAALRATSPRC